MPTRCKYVLACIPSLLLFVWWQASQYAYAALGCSIGKSGSLPCIWHGTDLAGYIGAGMWIGMMLFGISLPITLAVFFEIYIRKPAKVSDNQAL